MKKILFILFVLINIQCLSAQDPPAMFMRRLPNQEWNKYIVLYPEGLYLTTASGIGSVICWGEWEQRDSIILFRRYPEAVSEQDIEFELWYDADAEGRTIVTTNIQALVNVSANGLSSNTLISGDDNRQVFPYQADSVGVVWRFNERGQQVKRVALYDSVNSRYNNVVRINMTEDDSFAYATVNRSHINHSYIIVEDEVLVEQNTGLEYVLMDSIGVERYMNRYFFTDELLATINEYRKNHSVIPHSFPIAKELYNPNSERFIQKFENSQKMLSSEELIDAICKMLRYDNGTTRPSKKILNSEDQYILLVNYLFCRNEDAREGIWYDLYDQLAEYPVKLHILTGYIEMLPDDIRGKAQEQLCRSLAGAHIIRTGSFDRGTFIEKFWEMMRTPQYIDYLSEITRDIDTPPLDITHYDNENDTDDRDHE